MKIRVPFSHHVNNHQPDALLQATGTLGRKRATCFWSVFVPRTDQLDRSDEGCPSGRAEHLDLDLVRKNGWHRQGSGGRSPGLNCYTAILLRGCRMACYGHGERSDVHLDAGAKMDLRL